MFAQKILLGLFACAGLSSAIPMDPVASSYPKFSGSRNPDSCPGYTASNVVKSDSGLTAGLALAGDACDAFGFDLKKLKLEVEYQTDERLHVKIFDEGLDVYQVQEALVPRPPHSKASPDSSALEFSIVEKPFSFKVTRKSNGEVLFDTSAAKLIFEDQYVRLRTSLPKNPHLYGLGEHSDPFHLPTNGYRRTLLNAESPGIPNNANLYGSHPVYFEHRGEKGTHGVFMLNADPMDIWINQTKSGDQYLEYNTIGGIIDLYFMAGSSPTEVSSQYADVIGHSAMFPYWSFGFHQCKYGYWDVNMVAEVVANYSTAGIPLEVMWTDIDYMDLRQDFTTDPERFALPKVRELVTTLHKRGQRYVLILDPAIHYNDSYAPYKRGHELDVFLKNKDGSEYLGIQWAGTVAWPDWFAPNTGKWWAEEIAKAFDAESGIDLDGIWVDMNEASNFCKNYDCNARDPGNNPPKPEHAPRPNTGRPIPGFPADFQPTKRAEGGQMKGLPNRVMWDPGYTVGTHLTGLTDNTILFNTTNYDGTIHYDTHNLYGHMMAHNTYDAMLARRPGLRPMVLTRSTFAGTGRKATHWFGDNTSTWEDYRTSIRQMLAWVSMHQMPMVGADVCGFNANTNEKLCARWALLGAFQPFYRNHAELSTIPQEFYQWPLTMEAGKKAIDTRYRLMDYIYTALYYQTKDGVPMINPMWFLYPDDPNTFAVQEQWFYGDALLISPVTTEMSDVVTFYLPKDRFYDYWTGEPVDGQGANVTQSGVSFTDIPVHIRGGTIIPRRVNSANTTALLRQQAFELVIALDAKGYAKGRLYLDEGEKIEQTDVSELTFEFKDGALSTAGSLGFAPATGEVDTVKKVIVLGQASAGSGGAFDSATSKVEIEGEWDLSKEFKVQI
ncbi:glycoside hydrolase family 31 protein [Lentithecium fluviatile CBS 122367]|uniref:alpha-glucosidase n=1 Tax=Lentithecium fluviatile CBS 122367 TaxID=1168545 RepID=A0A6G1JHT9_9PLEO|nr:glycoside hydrolase family 31 protein [Lentithecium fluviatile CBS 122367]